MATPFFICTCLCVQCARINSHCRTKRTPLHCTSPWYASNKLAERAFSKFSELADERGQPRTRTRQTQAERQVRGYSQRNYLGDWTCSALVGDWFATQHNTTQPLSNPTFTLFTLPAPPAKAKHRRLANIKQQCASLSPVSSLSVLQASLPWSKMLVAPQCSIKLNCLNSSLVRKSRTV